MAKFIGGGWVDVIVLVIATYCLSGHSVGLDSIMIIKKYFMPLNMNKTWDFYSRTKYGREYLETLSRSYSNFSFGTQLLISVSRSASTTLVIIWSLRTTQHSELLKAGLL